VVVVVVVVVVVAMVSKLLGFRAGSAVIMQDDVHAMKCFMYVCSVGIVGDPLTSNSSAVRPVCYRILDQIRWKRFPSFKYSCIFETS
jgi:hypothetical protein